MHHVEIIQCPQLGTVYQRRDGIRITVDNYISIYFHEDIKLVLQIKTSRDKLAFPLPDDENLRWFLTFISEGRFQKRPSTYEYLEAKLIKGAETIEAFLPWTNE